MPSFKSFRAQILFLPIFKLLYSLVVLIVACLFVSFTFQALEDLAFLQRETEEFERLLERSTRCVIFFEGEQKNPARNATPDELLQIEKCK